MSSPLRITGEMLDALATAKGVVALETTLVAHGLPAGEGAKVEGALRASGSRAVRSSSATIGSSTARSSGLARRSDHLDVRPRGKRGRTGSARSRRVLRAEGARGDDRRRHARCLPAGGDPGDGDRRPRWSPPRLRHEARRVGRSRRARPGPRDRRLLRGQEPARRAGDVRAARDPRHPRARVPHRRAPAVLCRARRPARLGTRRGRE